MTHDVTLHVNGEARSLTVEARRTLADALRDDLGLIGTHLGCEHGVCGACTVSLDGVPTRACLVFAVQCDRMDVRTVEGLAGPNGLHPVQAAFERRHALQCGFCTPGFVVLAAAVLEREPDISDEDLLDAVSANLCRCTGYQNIIAAVREAAAEMAAESPPRSGPTEGASSWRSPT